MIEAPPFVLFHVFHAIERSAAVPTQGRLDGLQQRPRVWTGVVLDGPRHYAVTGQRRPIPQGRGTAADVTPL